MLIGIHADGHIAINSSIVLGQRGSLNGRLSVLLESYKWMYELFSKRNVDFIVNLGDLVDSYNLLAEEITATSQALSYNPGIMEYILLGNHERKSGHGDINSIEFVNNIPNCALIKKVSQLEDFTFIPYGIYEDGAFDDIPNTKYAFSHIDIYGSDTGGWSLKSGITPQYLMTKFDLVINGHIHNGSWVVKDRILNIGSISGQNFSSKILNWKPSVGILNTDTGKVELIENPYSLNFYSKTLNGVDKIIKFIDSLDGQRNVLQLKVPLSIADEVRNVIESSDKIVNSRISVLTEESGLEGLELEEIERLNSVEGGFKKLVEYIEAQDDLPYHKDDILKIVAELEANQLT